MAVRRTGSRPDPAAADAAARRLALIAADLGVTRPAAPWETEGETGTGASGSVAGWWDDHTHVAEVDEPVEPAQPPEDRQVPRSALPPPALPRAGRHVSRRPWARPALAALVGRVPVVGPAQVAVVAIAVAVGLAVTTWWVLRDQDEVLTPMSAQPAAPLVGVGGGAAPSGTASALSAATTGATTATVTVDVAGKVRRPGIVVLDIGARVTDALNAAGGPRKGVDLISLNLARVLVDGEQIVVGGPPAAGVGGSTAGAGGGAGAAAGPLVNLNTAGQAELETLPQVGPVTAQSIISWRETNGGFTSIDELLEVDGIGDKTLARLAPHVTV